MTMEIGLAIRATALAAVLGTAAFSAAGFKSFEKDKVLAYWNQPSRYQVSLPDTVKTGPWQVRLTCDGSLWLWCYNNKRGLGKTFTTPVARSDEERSWEDWIDAKVAYDRWMAAFSANISNTALGFPTVDPGPEPLLPGPIPYSLRLLVGDAPNFALAVEPKQHVVTFHDGLRLTYQDNTNMQPRYAYYRSADGVRSGGTQMKKLAPEEIDGLFSSAGLTGQTQHVMKAVSMLEGGFDSVNTYDTGFVSVGFIQFACLAKGNGSLGSVLLREKQKDSTGFDNDFRQYGIDVKDDGTLVALGLNDGLEYEGPQAAHQIIEDKRLIAVFQRAGLQSKPFRVAQIQIAKEQYYPADETFTVTLDGHAVTAKVSDVMRSEAGMATIMDRKVNTGKITVLGSAAQQVASANGVKTLEELASYERDIMSLVKFRKDYSTDDTLSQPAARARTQNLTSRSGTRKGRTKHKS